MKTIKRYRRLLDDLAKWAAVLMLLIKVAPHLSDDAGNCDIARAAEVVGSGEGVQGPDTGGGTGMFQ